MIEAEELRERIAKLPCRALPQMIVLLVEGHKIEDILEAAEFNLEHEVIAKWAKAGGKI
jgi:hypothetical protein